jgi:hypothetical protein
VSISCGIIRHPVMTLLLLLVSMISVSTQTPTAMDRLQGRWTGTGQVRGQAAKAELQFERVLDGRFTRLSYRFGEEVAGRFEVKFEGHAYYRCASAQACTGQWFDTLGFVREITATQTADTLASEWKTAGSEAGKSEYKLGADGTLAVTDWVRLPDGTFREFGRVSYTRAK